MAFSIKILSVLLIGFTCLERASAADAAKALIQSANQKAANVNPKASCFNKTNSCPQAMMEWVLDDKSLGILPSYERLKICQGSRDLQSANNIDTIISELSTYIPQISKDAIIPSAACFSVSQDLDRKAVFKVAYFLSRAEAAIQKNIKRLRAYDLILNDKSALAQVDCSSPIFTRLNEQCKLTGECAPSKDQRQKTFLEIEKIDDENKAIDKSIEKLKQQLPYARDKKTEEQIKALEMIKKTNLQNNPILTNPDYIEARKDGDSTSYALTKAYKKERANLLEQTQNLLDKSLCAVTTERVGCSPADLNAALLQTEELPEVENRKSNDFTIVADGLEQQKCIFENVSDRNATSKTIWGAARHAALDVALTLVPGGVAIVAANRAKTAAELGINATRGAAQAARLTAVADAMVSTAWLSTSALDAMSACQTKYTKAQAEERSSSFAKEKTNQCEQIISSVEQAEFSSSDCIKAIMFASMDGLPILAFAGQYAKKSEELAKNLQESVDLAAKTKAAQEAERKERAAREKLMASNAKPRNLAAITPEVQAVAEKFNAAGFRLYKNGTKEVTGEKAELTKDALEGGKSYTVLYERNGTLTLGEDYLGYHGTSGSHMTLNRDANQRVDGYIGGAIRVNKDGSIDVSGYNQKNESSFAAGRIAEAISKAIPGVKIRQTGDRLSTLPPQQ